LAQSSLASPDPWWIEYAGTGPASAMSSWPCSTSADIANRLGPAVATMNNNLAWAYTKLGIIGRTRLRSLLRSAW
jgi:hypothetical protein